MSRYSITSLSRNHRTKDANVIDTSFKMPNELDPIIIFRGLDNKTRMLYLHIQLVSDALVFFTIPFLSNFKTVIRNEYFFSA